jgi:diguanylate cyclase (GGDEF)-like protein
VSEGRKLSRILFEIGKVIGSTEDLPDLLGRVSQLVTGLVGASACSIMLLDEERSRLLGKAAYGLERDDVGALSFRVGDGVAGWVAETGEPALIADVTEDERFVELPGSSHRIRSLTCVPLISRGQLVGVMTATAPGAGAFDEEHLELLGFVAATMAVDIQNVLLRRLAITDQLTGLYNREYLHRHLSAVAGEADLSGEPLSAVMIDIDHFKRVNDEHGHDVGDAVLIEVAARLRGAVRGRDSLIRYGGEEILAVLPGSDEAAAVAERMRRRLEADPIRVSGRDIEVRISAGVARHRAGEILSDVIRRADRALYRAKAAGRNRVCAAE